MIVTPTLGERESLVDTIKSVRVMGVQSHVCVCPEKNVEKVREICGSGFCVKSEIRKGGVYAAVNEVLLGDRPQSKWVGYLNDDDYWLPGMKILLNRSEVSSADIIYGRVEFVDWRGKHIAFSTGTGFYRLFPYLASYGVYIFTQQAVLIKRSLFTHLGGFDEQYKIQADNDFWIRAIKAGARCEYVDGVCAAYRVHENQLTAGRLGLIERQRMLTTHNLAATTVRSRLSLLFYRLANAPMYFGRVARGRRSVRAEAGR